MTRVGREELIDLQGKAVAIRRNVLRLIRAGEMGHVGGAMSVVEILTALYFKVMRIDPDNPQWPKRDRLILSAGHKCLALYATLAVRGFFDDSLLDTHGALHSKLPGHPDMKKLPGVEANTGALGHGLSIAGGIAMAAKMDSIDIRVYVVTGDGELNEGSNWEAASAITHHRLDNILVIVDKNRLQIGGATASVNNYDPLTKRWEAFGWSVREVDGHSIGDVVQSASVFPFERMKPSVLIAHTVKSKGLSFAENNPSYHYWKPTAEELVCAKRELDEQERRLGT
jgi:transketolase